MVCCDIIEEDCEMYNTKCDMALWTEHRRRRVDNMKV